MPSVTDHFYQQVSESVKLVFDLTSRIDERVKMLVEQHNDSNQRIEKIVERHENFSSRITVLENKNGNNLDEIKKTLKDTEKTLRELEIKVAALQIHSGQHESKFKTAGDFVFKIVVAVIGGYIVWKLGIK
jgi:TolA-binding protein